MVLTVRLGTNLRHALSVRQSNDAMALSGGAFLLPVKTTDLDFLQVRFFVGRSIGAQDTSPNSSLKSEKIRWILPKFGKESVDLPEFVKDSVTVLQILFTF